MPLLMNANISPGHRVAGPFPAGFWPEPVQDPSGPAHPEPDVETQLSHIRAAGIKALYRMVRTAHQRGPKGRRATCLLLSLHDSCRYVCPDELVRELDTAAFCDWLAILAMDHTPEIEIHQYISDGAAVFAKLARSEHALHCSQRN